METCVFLQCPAHRWSPLYDRHTGFTGFTLPVQLCIGLSTHWRQPWSILCSDSHQKQLHLGKLQAVVTDLTCVTLQHLFPPCISPSFGTSSRSVLPVNVMLKIHQSDFNPHTACFSKVRLNCLTGPSKAVVLSKRTDWPQRVSAERMTPSQPLILASENRLIPYIILEQWKLNSSVLIYSPYTLTSLL